MKYAKLENGRIVYAPHTLSAPGRLLSNPGEEEYRAAGWLPVVEEAVDSGKTRATVEGDWVRVGWDEVDGVIRGVYEVRPVSPVILLSKEKICRKLDELGMTAAFFAWLQSSAEIFCGWTEAGDTLPYDPAAHDGILAGLLEALEISPEMAEVIIGELRADV